MHATSILKLLVAALSATTATQAFLIDGGFLGPDVRSFRDLQQRQADSSGSGNAPVATTSSSTSSTAEETTTSTSSTTTPDPATPTPVQTTSSSSSADDATPTTPSDDTPAASTSAGGDTLITSTTRTTSSTTATPEPTTATTVIVITQSDGSLTSSTSVSVTTPTAVLTSSGSSGSNSGMSTQTRNTIIGVVVGIGGAIVLAVAGIFAWRIWGRRKNGDENDVLMGFKDADAGTSGVGGLGVAPMATTPASVTSPFQSTLEQYHTSSAPQRNVNTAANF